MLVDNRRLNASPHSNARDMDIIIRVDVLHKDCTSENKHSLKLHDLIKQMSSDAKMKVSLSTEAKKKTFHQHTRKDKTNGWLLSKPWIDGSFDVTEM